MNKRKLTNEELDRIGRASLRAAAVSGDEIENIVSSPMLFNSIKDRIEAERPENKRIGWFAQFSLLTWNRAAAAFTIAAIFLAGTVAILVFAKRNRNMSSPEQAAKQDQPIQPEKDRPAPAFEPPAPEVSGPAGNVTAASYKKEPVRAQKVVVHRPAARKTESPVFEAEGDFYPVAGTPGGMPQDGHVVRAEIPRSSLVAMGVVDLPIEGGNEKIKTDLLVGSDGVVRGIRIVK
jgi:hypothetical protein